MFSSSIGNGKMIVEFFSDAISVSVCRYRSVTVTGSLRDDRRGLAEFLRGLQLAFRVDDLSTLLALGFGLAGHRALHVGGQIDVLDLHRRHLDAPRIGALIEDVLQVADSVSRAATAGRRAPTCPSTLRSVVCASCDVA